MVDAEARVLERTAHRADALAGAQHVALVAVLEELRARCQEHRLRARPPQVREHVENA